MISTKSAEAVLALNRALAPASLRASSSAASWRIYRAHYEAAITRSGLSGVRYEDGVYLLLKQIGSTWYVTDIWATEEPTAFAPMLFWVRVKRGWQIILRQIVIGWRNLTSRSIKNTAYGEAIS